jgi:hypothetical protein
MGFYPGATTQVRDADGTFELRGVTPGPHILMAESFDGGKGLTALQPVDVGNDNVENISLLLSAGMDLKSVVRVDGPGGAALGNLQVSLAPQEMMRMGMQGAKVADDGSFSLSGVPPAIYTIEVFGMRETFYIKSVRMGDADGLEAGLDLTHEGAGALEIVLSPNGGQVDGSVVDSKQAATTAALVLAPEGRRREQRSFFRMVNTDAQGIFEFRGVAPGAYFLIAQWGQGEKLFSAQQPIDVRENDIDNIVLELSASTELKGNLRVEGRPLENLTGIHVMMEPGGSSHLGWLTGQVHADGSFTLNNVATGQYQLQVQGASEDYYVKSARLGDKDVLDSGIDGSRAASGPLGIVLTSNGGQVEGVVLNAEEQPATGAAVVLVPESGRRSQSRFYKETTTDQYGRYHIKGIAPGEYKLFAWDDVENGVYEDPEFLKGFEAMGEAVAIREGCHESRQLRVIVSEGKKPAN